MNSWLKRIGRKRGEPSGRGLNSAAGGVGTRTPLPQGESPDELRANLELAADNHERLVHELEQAAAAHRLAARNLRARLNAVSLHRDSEISGSATWESQEEQAVFSEYPVVARLLGPFEFTVHGTKVEPWRSQRAASLLKYLLLFDGGPVRREVLMREFWPFSNSNSARNNLNVSVYALRQILSIWDPEHPYIIYRDGTYLLNSGVRRWVDVPEYIAACQLGHRHFDAGELTKSIAAYQRGRHLYRGSLMEGDMSGDWFRDDEIRLRDQHHSVLERLGTALLRHGEFGESVDIARELVRADPCRETGHQLLMRAYASLRQPQLVVRQYRQCADVLRSELSVEPDAATRALLKSLVGTYFESDNTRI